jgi:threonylcarbamoyladenosine tRNA methylthiotransferase MtaB
MPAVPRRVRQERAARLRQRGHERLGAWLRSRVGRTASVLLEDAFRGRSEHGVTVRATGEPGTIVDVAVAGVEAGALVALEKGSDPFSCRKGV